MSITKAIIPVAGWGTRRLPITKAIEKCMLPIGNRPIVDYVVYDCIVAGIRDIYFVISEESTQVQAYYGENAKLHAYLAANQREDLLRLIAPLPGVTFHYVRQPNNGKYGTAVPVGLVAPLLQPGESVAVLMGDDFVYNADGSSEVARLMAATPENGNALLSAAIDPAVVSNYGVLALDEQGNYAHIVDRPTPEAAPSSTINISKYVMNYDLIKAAESYTSADMTGEYHMTEVMNQYVSSGGSVKVVPIEGQYLDGGSVGGWLHANNLIVNGR
ncbi:MAG TPA: sugar phosphate nucleotidyltransferase [Candidatus Saccharimonadales bacterium]|nr:sugar phosphate nucleotidyltransferase [Candidatus Saccharimonadales bacterium]